MNTNCFATNETELVRYKIDKEKYTVEIILKKDRPDYEESGWNIYLNDRRVVASDKTDLTGWDIGAEEQYHVIRGYVYAKAGFTIMLWRVPVFVYRDKKIALVI